MLNFNWVTVGGFLLLCGTAYILSSWVWKSALRQRRRLRWPRVRGKVLEHRMRREGSGTYLEYLVAYEVEGEAMQRVARDWSPPSRVFYRRGITWPTLPVDATTYGKGR